jgi:hypothetical protein
MLILDLETKPHYREQAKVHLKAFGKLLDWFGPLEPLDPFTAKSKQSFLAKVIPSLFILYVNMLYE